MVDESGSGKLGSCGIVNGRGAEALPASDRICSRMMQGCGPARNPGKNRFPPLST